LRDLDAESENAYFSAAAVHSFSFSQNAFSCPGNLTSCRRSLSLTWVGHGQCQVVLTCPTLMGNVCGSYAPSLASGEEVCWSGQFSTKSYQRGDNITFQVDVWQNEEASSASCLAWCSNGQNGKLRGRGQEEAADLLLRALVKAQETAGVTNHFVGRWQRDQHGGIHFFHHKGRVTQQCLRDFLVRRRLEP